MNRPLRLFAIATAAVLISAPNVFAAAGDLDPSFNPGSGPNVDVDATAVQPDGKVVIGGSFTEVNGVTRNYVARLNANGSLDTTFNVGSGPSGQVYAVALQPDGKILIGGTFQTVNTFQFRNIARLNSNGTVDTSFFPGADFPRGANNAVRAITLQADNKILIGGAFTQVNDINRNRIARLHTNGSLDDTFAPAGGAGGVSGVQVRAIGLLNNGKIMIGGLFTSYDGMVRNRVARLHPNGVLDTTFNPGTGIDGSGVFALAVQPDGKTLLGGVFFNYNNSTAAHLVRVNTDGSRDSTFNPDINVNNSRIDAIRLLPTGKILIGGGFTTGEGTTLRRDFCRLEANGVRDGSFGHGFGPSGPVNAISLAADNKVIIAGNFSSYDSVERNRVARLFLIPPALRNISTRSVVQTGDRVAIAGFIITGSGAKEVLLRGIGPSLTALGVPGALQDPVIELYNSSGGLINSNNNWRDTQENAIAETTLQPSDNREAALLINLGPGSYTVMHKGINQTTGNGLIEVYDLTGGTTAKLANISTRAFVGAGDNVLIGGFILEASNARVVVRAIGPSLTPAGVSGALADPRVALYDGNGGLVGFNLDWRDGQEADIAATGLQPSNNLEAAVIVTLQAGNYTAIVEGFDGTTGVGLVEVYHVNP
jgi:uncharacterized delta-60 repeat protein